MRMTHCPSEARYEDEASSGIPNTRVLVLGVVFMLDVRLKIRKESSPKGEASLKRSERRPKDKLMGFR